MDMVADKSNAGIVDMVMDNAPATQLPGTVEAVIKNVINTALFWE